MHNNFKSICKNPEQKYYCHQIDVCVCVCKLSVTVTLLVPKKKNSLYQITG